MILFMKKQIAMKKIKKIMMILVLPAIFLVSCEDLTELNENPNGVTIESANPNLLMTTVLTETARSYLNFGFGIAAGVMQHCQKDAWFSSYNNYDWGPSDWDGYYSLLRTNQKVMDIAKEKGLEFQEGVSLVMRAFLFAQIADLWGDAPYTNALKGDEGGPQAGLRLAGDDLQRRSGGSAGSLPAALQGQGRVYRHLCRCGCVLPW